VLPTTCRGGEVVDRTESVKLLKYKILEARLEIGAIYSWLSNIIIIDIINVIVRINVISSLYKLFNVV